MSFFEELKRRNVVRTGIAYVLIAWVVLQIIDFLLELTDAPSWVLQVFFITAAVGLPVVLIFSWVYEMTPEGIKREKEVQRDESITPQTGRKLDRLIIGALALVVVVLLAGRFLPDEPVTADRPAVAQEAPAGSADGTTSNVEAAKTAGAAAASGTAEAMEAAADPSIAVLPFVNMSPDPNQEYFADGVSEEILNALARVDGLKVAGRTSSFVFKDRTQDLREIGEALGVDHILEGSVRTQGERVRITAQLVKADDGFHLWSDTFDREMDDIFAIQDEIASAILQQTRIQLLDGESVAVKRVDTAAYQNYIAAKQRIHERTRGGLEVASKLLRDATEIDPTFAAAWAQLGIATLLLSDGRGSYGDIPAAEAQALGRQYLERALSLEPELAEALAGMGLYWQEQPPNTSVERARSLEYLKRALARNPALINASHWYQRALQAEGKYDEALAVLEAMVERDPLYWPALSNLIGFYVAQNRLELAQELNVRSERYRPELPYRLSGTILVSQGRSAEALPYVREAWQARQDGLTFIRYADAHFGLHDYATPVDDEAAPDTMMRAFGLAYLQRPEEAVQVATRALQSSGNPGAMILALSLSGQTAALLAFFEERWDNPTAFYTQQGPSGVWGYTNMLELANAFAAEGRNDWFREAMALVRTEHDRSIEAGFDNLWLNMSEAAYWNLAGEPERAMDEIDRALAKGFGYTPRFSRQYPQLRSLEGLPRYEEQQQRALAHINEQRELAGMTPLEVSL